MSGEKLGVLLVQLGGPERREELKPFLYELFVDPEILNIRFTPARKLVAWLIATRRSMSRADRPQGDPGARGRDGHRGWQGHV